METNEQMEHEISSRSSSSSLGCQNFIINGDFSDNSFTELNDCYNGIPDGLVSGWSCSFGSADLLGPDSICAAVVLTAYCLTSPFPVCMKTNNSTGYTEGIMTNVNLPFGQGITYSMCLDASGADANIVVVGTSGFTGSCGPNNGPPVFAPSEYLYQGAIDCNASNHTIDFDFALQAPITQIILYGNRRVEVDNISLHCHNDNVLGVTTVEISNCEYQFRPQLGAQLGIDEVYWDFGDGTTGTGQVVTHTFTQGVHYITMTVTDEFGCCTTRNTVVYCDADECTSHICHEDAINEYKCTAGFVYDDPISGAVDEILYFNQFCYTADFDCIAIQMQAAFHAEGFTNMTVYSEDPTQNIQCYKAGIGETKGIFVFGHIQVKNLFGTELHWNGYTSCDRGVDPNSLVSGELINGGQFSTCD